MLLLGAFLRDRRARADGTVLAERLCLGNRAARTLETVAAAGLPSRWLQARAVETEGLYGMYRRYGDCFEELLLLEAAAKLPPRRRKGAVIGLLARYGRAEKRFALPPLLTGRSAMEAFGLPPGEQLGDLLRKAKKAQDLGFFNDRAGALDWAGRALRGDDDA